MRRLSPTILALAALFLVAVPLAGAAVELKGVDASAYPTVRMSVVTPAPTAHAPRLLENGGPVNGLLAENLGRAKSVMLTVDRSQSMKGKPFGDAVAAAYAFLGAKQRQDRVAVATFATKPVVLTGFSTSAGDAQSALRSLAVDPVEGTTLYDSLVQSARALSSEPHAGRVIVAVTDGNETRSAASLQEAIAAAREAGASVYVVAIESDRFNPAPLKSLARETGGSYRGAGSSRELAAIYAGIARELQRTWRLEYPTAARPGEELQLQALTAAGKASSAFSIPGTDQASGGGTLLPKAFYSAGTPMMALFVGLLVLLAATFATAAARGERLRRQLAPHLGTTTARKKRKAERERLAMLSSLFRATEQTFSHWRHWRSAQRMLERADLPLRTVEFVYLMAGAGIVFGLVAAVTAPSSFMVVLAMLGGAALPFGFVWFKGQQRINAFENQLPDLLITLAASLKAGHSFKQGLQSVVDEGRPPASKELKRVLTEARLGRSMDDALQEMALRVGSKNFDFVITAVTIQRQVGGSLAGLIDMVADTVRQRQQFARKIKGLTAMGRASAYVLMGLPFFIGFVITIMNPRYMDPLYNTSTGHKLIMVGLAMMCFGAVVLRKIVAFKG
jgi:tight adherence protein B